MTLLVVMIVGFLVLIVSFVTRFPSAEDLASTSVSFDLPETLDIPKGVTPEAFTRGSDWVAIVAENEILIFDAATGTLRQRVAINTATN